MLAVSQDARKINTDIVIRTECMSNIIDNIENERKALHEAIEIKCFYEGSATLLVGDKTVTANAGDAVVINPYEFHATVACGEQKGRYHLFMIPLDFLSDTEAVNLRTMFFVKHTSFKTLFRNNDRIFGILMRAAKEYTEKASFYELAVTGLLTELFAVLLRSGTEHTPDSPLNKNLLHSYRLAEPAVRYIRDNYSNTVSVEELACLCGISKHYFCRVFKNVTGKTVMEYLQDYRLKVADTFLANSDKSISEIAGLCGFESSNYFCRCYKRVYGISPGKSRKKST